MIVYRCLSHQFKDDPLSAIGAKAMGGRFNSIGVPAIYTAEHRAMAIFEILVRIPIHILVSTNVIIPITLPDKNILEITPWNNNWKNEINKSQQLGNKALGNTHNTVIKVPSSLLNNSFNYLINPNGNDFSVVNSLAEEPILIDERLLKAMSRIKP